MEYTRQLGDFESDEEIWFDGVVCYDESKSGTGLVWYIE